MKSKIILLATVLFTLTTLGGSSALEQTNVGNNGQSVKASGSKLDACSLLIKGDAEGLMGESAGSPTSSQVGDAVSRCGYASLSGGKRVSLLARRASSASEALQIFK